MEKNSYRIDWKHLDINLEGRGTPVNPLVAMLLAAVLGLTFVVFLPVIGFYLALGACLDWIWARRAGNRLRHKGTRETTYSGGNTK